MVNSLDGAFLGNLKSSVAVPLCRAEGAKIAWVNPRAKLLDKNFDWYLNTEEDYREHLISSCAYEIDFSPDRKSPVNGFADRYGGNGIGVNGGSGRAVIVNGYYVKGVGPTPLVGVTTKDSHANGAACLEEGIREAIFSEIIDAEFPYGSLPVLAILLLGKSHTWIEQDRSLASDARCLIIRPVPIRPAHFERATFFLSGKRLSGSFDHQRVGCNFGLTKIHVSEFSTIYDQLWWKWSGQLAYGYAFRLPHCGVSTSNICLDGRLMDFGATAALPAWGRASVVLGGVEAGEELQVLLSVLKDQAPFLSDYFGKPYDQEEYFANLMNEMITSYCKSNHISVLRVLGLTLEQAKYVLSRDSSGEIVKLMRRSLSRFNNLYYSIFRSTPNLSECWDVDEIWGSNPGALLGLRDLLLRKFLDSNSCVELDRRAKLRCKPRKDLFREVIRNSILSIFFSENEEGLQNFELIQNFIDEIIVKNRRDTLCEIPGTVPVGFGSHRGSNYTILQRICDLSIFAINEESFKYSNGHSYSDDISLYVKMNVADLSVKYIHKEIVIAKS